MTIEETEWFKSRPPAVQKLVLEFPLDSIVLLDDRPHFILGYTEGDRIILTPIDPSRDYDGAMDARVYLCANHLRGQTPEVMTLNDLQNQHH